MPNYFNLLLTFFFCFMKAQNPPPNPKPRLPLRHHYGTNSAQTSCIPWTCELLMFALSWYGCYALADTWCFGALFTRCVSVFSYVLLGAGCWFVMHVDTRWSRRWSAGIGCKCERSCGRLWTRRSRSVLRPPFDYAWFTLNFNDSSLPLFFYLLSTVVLDCNLCINRYCFPLATKHPKVKQMNTWLVVLWVSYKWLGGPQLQR